MNERILLILAFILACGLCVFAQEDGNTAQETADSAEATETAVTDADSHASNEGGQKMGLGLGLEWNMNSRENFSGGIVLGFDYNLPISFKQFAAGVTFTISNNFSGITVIEPAAMFRWYFLGSDYFGWFAQADIGAFLVVEDPENSYLFLGGVRGGFRLPFGTKFYVEPFGRFGYPFMFGIGAMAGMKL